MQHCYKIDIINVAIFLFLIWQMNKLNQLINKCLIQEQNQATTYEMLCI